TTAGPRRCDFGHLRSDASRPARRAAHDFRVGDDPVHRRVVRKHRHDLHELLAKPQADALGARGGGEGGVVVALAAAQSTASAIEGLAGDEEEIDRLEGDLVARRGLGNAERTALHGFTGREREEAQPRMAALDAGEGAAKAPRRERLEDREGVELPGQGKVERDRRAGPGLHEGREREEPFLRKEGAAGDLVRKEGGAQAIDGRAERALFVEAWLHRRKKESPALAVW